MEWICHVICFIMFNLKTCLFLTYLSFLNIKIAKHIYSDSGEYTNKFSHLKCTDWLMAH